MNWLDPAEVEAWLAAHPHRHPLAETHGEQSALEQFVRALAKDEPAMHLSDCESPDYECSCLFGVARLLVKAMGEK